MAEGTATGGKSSFGFLSQKTGPFPLWMWIAGGIGVWYFLGRGKGTPGSGTGAANQQTDPAGNIGSIDPATGYVYGTPEDTAALAANNAGTGSDTGTGSGSTTAGQYPDDATWGRAAVNYLVGIGVDPTQANQAITLYLASQPLSTTQQADVNSAIQALGAPPDLPGPAPGNPGTITQPPGGTPPVTHTPPPHEPPPYKPPAAKPQAPKNLRVTGNNGTSVQVSWDLPGGAKTPAGWLVQNHLGGSSGTVVDSFVTNNTVANLGGALAKPKAGLKPKTKYTVRIRENVSGAPWGSVSYTTK